MTPTTSEWLTSLTPTPARGYLRTKPRQWELWLTFGPVTAGDTIVFELKNLSYPGEIFASQPSLSTLDGINHAYLTPYTGGFANIPAGTFVGFEDLPLAVSDLDYNDDQFVFQDISSQTTPEPGTLLMFGSGVVGLASLVRRRINL